MLITKRSMEEMQDELEEKYNKMEDIFNMGTNAYVRELIRNCPSDHLLVLGLDNAFYRQYFNRSWGECIKALKKDLSANLGFEYIYNLPHERLCILNPSLYKEQPTNSIISLPWPTLEYGEYIKKWEYILPQK